MPYLFILLLPFAVQAATPIKILIDPGHGGRDRGTMHEGTSEADITLSVSHQLMTLLARNKRFQAQLTRSDDRSLSLNTRARLAKDTRADLFVSIHVNSSPEPRARGAEFYFQNQLPPDEESMFLAHKENETVDPSDVKTTYEFIDHSHYSTEVTAIVSDLLDSDRVLRSSQLSRALKSAWHGGNRRNKSLSVRQAPFYVLNQMTTPSVLVELGFLTNAEDYRDLTNPRAQAQMAEDLYRGLVAWAEDAGGSALGVVRDHVATQPPFQPQAFDNRK